MNFDRRHRPFFALSGVVAVIGLLTLPLPAQTASPVPAPSAAVTNAPISTYSAPPSAGDFFFHDGDSPIVFLGDDVTEQGKFTTLLETYLLTRFPDWKVTFRNAGWTGDTCGLIKRGDFATAVQRDVLALKPRVVVVEFGLNDARAGDALYVKYLDNMTTLLQAVQKNGSRVVLLTPTPEENYEAGALAGSAYNDSLKQIFAGAKVVSDNQRVPLIDDFTPLVDDIEAGRQSGVLSKLPLPNSPVPTRLLPDGLHPNWGGNLILATAILQAMHAPAEVSSVTVDAEAHSIFGTRACQVELSQVPNVAVQFKRVDQVLPWPLPVDPSITLAEKIPGFDPATALNSYGLKVTGLKDGTYKLLIDNVPCGAYSAADFAKGLNLAALTQGPIFDQGQSILRTVQLKNDAYFQRWRNVQLFELPDWMAKNPAVTGARDAEEARLDLVISDAEKKIDFLRHATPHVFKIVAGH